MAYRYKLTPLAISDMDDVFNYISRKLLNPKAYHGIQQEIIRICDNPYAFPNCSYYLLEDESIRHAVVRNYILIYEVSPAEEMIIILRFLYGGRDISHIGITAK